MSRRGLKAALLRLSMVNPGLIFFAGALIVCGGVALFNWRAAVVLFGAYVMFTGWAAGVKRSKQHEPEKKPEELS